MDCCLASLRGFPACFLSEAAIKSLGRPGDEATAATLAEKLIALIVFGLEPFETCFPPS